MSVGIQDKRTILNRKEHLTRTCHIISGDLWAGAETQAYILILGLLELGKMPINVIVFNKGLLFEKLKSAGVRVDIIDESAHSFPKMIWKIYKVLKKSGANIVHTHGYKETLLGGIAVKCLKKKAVVRTFHGKGVLNSRSQHQLIEWFNRLFLTAKMIAVSNDLKKFLVSKKFDEKQIKVIHNAINAGDVQHSEEVSEVKKQLNINSTTIVIGTVGRMVAVKGHKYFLEGAKLILRYHSDVIFVIVGDGPLFQETQESVKKLGLEEKVRLIGFQKDIIDIINIFDIFTMTSLHEGMPMALLEAMVLGKAIVSTKVGGIPEIILHRYNGILISEKDSSAFSAACNELIENAEFGDSLGLNARNDALLNLGVNKLTERVDKLYQGLLK